MQTFEIRNAEKEDSALILQFIKELAEYEKMADLVVATVEDVEHTIFGPNPKAEVLIISEKNKPAGFALFFHNYSTFLCKYGIYIEDIYIREEYRGKGFGKALLQHICKLAITRDCGRVEWWCLDWNKSSIDFYLNLGAEPMSDWTVYRLDRKSIDKITNNKVFADSEKMS